MATSATATGARTRWITTARGIAVVVPIWIWVTDSFFGLGRCEGSSMEPTLRHGDVFLIRKCEAGALTEAVQRLLGSAGALMWPWRHKKAPSFEGNPRGLHATTTSGVHLDEAMERARILHLDHASSPSIPLARLWEQPPLALPGHVVVYKDPEAYPPRRLCKRVVGVGGQWLRQSIAGPSEAATPALPRHSVSFVPPYTLYVEGDHRPFSRDSRHTGPISKNLLVGVAEYVIWPPTRWQRLRRQGQKADPFLVDAQGQPRAFWP